MQDIIKNPKISVVMQSYLGEYDGSRKEPVKKFHRAVKSLLNNTYKNSEIVIVSDGCEITHNEYLQNYSDNSRVKYSYVSKPKEKMMYSTSNGEQFFRGLPRKIGVSLSDGDLITYLDSDDYIEENYLQNIIQDAYLASPESDWWINRSYFDNKIISEIWKTVLHYRTNSIDYKKGFDKLFEILDTDSFDDGIFNFQDIDSDFVKTRIKPGFFSGITSLTTHRKSCLAEWKDTLGISEDFSFGKELRKNHPNGFFYDSPGYVRCHYRGIWDV
jgi:glycosyltransferase involved in cell wall biosynthesis